MNLGRSAVVLRPRRLAEVLDLTCRVCCSLALGPFLRLGAALLAPIFAGCLALRYAADWPWAALWLVAVSSATIVQGAFTTAIGRLLFSEELGVRAALGLYARRLGSYLWMLALTRAMLAAAGLTFIGLPFVWARFLLVHETSLLENASAMQAVRRAGQFNFAAGGLGVLLSLLAAQAGFVVVAELLGQGLVDEVLQLGRPFGALWSDGGSPYALCGFLMSVPFVATARFLLYIDHRTRSDGWDVQIRFLAIAARAEPERRAAA